MPTIYVSDDFHAFIKSKAEPWVDKSEQDTIARLLGYSAEPSRATSPPLPVGINPRSLRNIGRLARKKPKVSLGELIRRGYLRPGQSLFLVDYQGARVEKAQAEVASTGLAWNGGEYSMSNLAAQLLKASGYSADSVRGPAHWVTEEGVTVLALWQRYRANGAA